MSEDPKKQEEILDNKKDVLDKTVVDHENFKKEIAEVQTAMLTDPDAAEPMVERDPDDDAIQLHDGWRIQFKIGDQKKTLPLKNRVTVGRAVDSDAKVNEINFDLTPFGAYHFGVSRHHAVMTLAEGYLYLEDLGSTNGTRINGFQLTANQRYRLRDGDEIEFARLRSNISFIKPDA
ncbi:MAG: FHA domain-containing protein [Chloroflexota bacterium]